MPRPSLRDRPWQLGLALVVVGIAWAGWRAMLGPQVPTYRVARQDLVAQVVASGQVMSPPRVTLAALSPARVDAVLVDVGDQVHAGQHLVELGDASIVAPSPGVVLERAVEAGEVVPAGKPLLVLSRAGELQLSVQAEERALAHLRPGQQALAVADAFPGQPFPAEVALVAPSVDRASGTVEVRLRAPAPPAFLRPGMGVWADIEVGRKAAALVAAGNAVHDASGDPWVLVVRRGRAERRRVVVGLRAYGLVEVTRGLAEGDVLVATWAPVIAGQRVRSRPAQPVEAAHAF